MKNKTKSIFFTSDWHVGHQNCLRFDKRPFKDLDEMHEKLIKNYNSTVPKDGICYFLGDMGEPKGNLLKSVIDKLNGTKVLILGNHDGNMLSMYNKGFDVVLYNATIYVKDIKITLSHCPLKSTFREDTINMRGSRPGEEFFGELWHGDLRKKHQKFTMPNEGQFHVHGHCHKKKRIVGEVITEQQYDIGVCGNFYRPVSLNQIIRWIYNSRNNSLERALQK